MKKYNLLTGLLFCLFLLCFLACKIQSNNTANQKYCQNNQCNLSCCHGNPLLIYPFYFIKFIVTSFFILSNKQILIYDYLRDFS